MIRRLAALALTLAMPVLGASAAGIAPTEAESAALQLALDRGKLLYAYDQAAWHATDDMIARARRADIYDQLMRSGGGYVVEGDARTQTVTFYDRAMPPNALYRAKTIEGGTQLASGALLAAREILTDTQQRLVRERQAVLEAARDQKLGMCANTMPNVAILPAQGTGGSDLGYFMTPQTDMKSWPIGGHYRFELRDGQPGAAQRFANSCLTMSAPPSPKGAPEMMVVTHLVSDTPTELHVFTALAAKLPILVIAVPTKKHWLVVPAGGDVGIRPIEVPKRAARGN